MQPHPPSHGHAARTRALGATRWTALWLAALPAALACSDKGTSTDLGPATADMPAGTSGSAVAGSSGGGSGAAGVSAAAGTQAPAAGDGAPAAGEAGSALPAGTGGAAGSMIAGAGGMAAGGSGGDGPGPGSEGCTRELLQGTIEAYFTALAAHDPSTLPLADGVKFTENGEVLQLGESLWQSAGMVEYSQSALDTETCSSASQAVVPDGGMAIPFALRLVLVEQRITEIETIAVRPGDYRVFGSNFPSDTGAIIAADETIGWEQAVPPEQRNTRDEIASWIDKYFRMFPRGICNVTSDCLRLENGGGSFDCDFGGSCDAAAPGSGPGVMEPRALLVDVETGIGVGFTMFMGNTDMHMYKMYGGQVHAVHAILAAADGSGWD